LSAIVRHIRVFWYCSRLLFSNQTPLSVFSFRFLVLIQTFQVSIRGSNNEEVVSQVDFVSAPASNFNQCVFPIILSFIEIFCHFISRPHACLTKFIRVPFIQRCSPQDSVFSVLGSCAVPVSSVLQGGTYVGSVSFVLRKIPTGFYQFLFKTADFKFISNSFQVFVYNPASAPSVPQQLSGPLLASSSAICLQFLAQIIALYFNASVDYFNQTVSQFFAPSNVFSVASPLANTQGVPLSDVYFKDVPRFYFISPPPSGSQDPTHALIAQMSSAGQVLVLSIPGLSDGVFPMIWQVQTSTSNLLCVSNPYGSTTSLYWMSSGLTSAAPLTLSQPMISILYAKITQDIPAIVPLSAILNSSSTFTVNVTFVCNSCLGLPNCACVPVLIAKVINLNASASCRRATISSNSSNGLLAFGSPICDTSQSLTYLFPTGGNAQWALCVFNTLVIDSATFGCSYRLQVLSPYSGAVVALSSKFTVCAVYPNQISTAPLCASQISPAPYSLYTWSGFFLPYRSQLTLLSSQPQFIKFPPTQTILYSVSVQQKVSFVLNVCGASVFSTMNPAFQPNFPPSFLNYPSSPTSSSGLQLQVNIRSNSVNAMNATANDNGSLLATCLLWVQLGPPCTVTVISGDCAILPFSNGNSYCQNNVLQSGFFCQSNYNPAGISDLQLQLLFSTIIPADDIGVFKISVDGSGSGGEWGFASPQQCVNSYFLNSEMMMTLFHFIADPSVNSRHSVSC